MNKNKILSFRPYVFCSLLFAVCISSPPLSMSAQNALGCDATRYSADVFTGTTLTTVGYGSMVFGSIPQVLQMDIVQPQNDTLKLRPLIIWAYGGGFINGAKEDMRPFCQLYSLKGYVTASINYRLYSFANGFPDSIKITRTIIQAVQDMKASIRYFKKSAKVDGNPYKVDTNNIIIGGVSAGAITAMIAAQMDSTDPIAPWIRTIIAAEGGFEGNSGTPGYSTNVKGAISMSGALARREWIDKGDVPFAAYHGTVDNVVAYGYGLNTYSFYGDGGGTLAPYAASIGLPAVLVTVHGGGHTDIYPSPTVPNPPTWLPWVATMTGFMKRLICGLTPLSSEEIVSQQVKIYPNPSNDDMTVELDKNTEGGKFDLSVFDAVGRQVFSVKNQTNPQLVLRKKDIGTGIFLVRLNFENSAKAVVKKVIFE